ncbi:helix-turn-helix domain-containing protein [Herbiconiux sp. CPCC 203407]|uniref:Helix-turn-helix domain-containing protein n=1 Tax=Herbiconiux oxytropis TaxID=2970915 RepID=A0AA42BUS5_9MICO|nr:helix-turn-helix domain-containing protein [Herbiconiux oxytropis]MCS5722546.1 helix-turn-helix domain-containing protein [Herbiconiux oxytropis]MCS5726486.1 helix-turn-helix domain-containing protein [Herbiconiux oxytropis]
MTTAGVAVGVLVAGGGTVVSPGPPDRAASSVHLLEDDGRIDDCAPGSIAVLTRAAASPVRGFRFDALLARAAHRGVVALVLPTPAILVPPRFDAASAAVGVVTVPPDTDLGRVVGDLSQVLAGEESAVLVRLRQGIEILEHAEASGIRSPELVAERLVAVLPGLEIGAARPGRTAVPSADPARAGEVWSVPTAPGAHADIDAVLLRVLATLGAGAARADEAPERTLSSIITELLVSRSGESSELGDRSRTLGFDPESWHLVLAVTLRRASGPSTGGESPTLEQIRREEAVRITALRTARTTGATWRAARVGAALLLICTWPRDPGRAGEERARESARAVHSALVESETSSAGVLSGVGRVHQGVAGLRRAAAEARSVLRMAPKASRSSFTVFDEFGLDQALVDWFSLDESQESARRLLAPFRTLPPEKAETLMKTLQAFLDHQGSVSATATALFIHRNAVGYRMASIRRILDSELDDPEERLALQLACRGRHLLPLDPQP